MEKSTTLPEDFHRILHALPPSYKANLIEEKSELLRNVEKVLTILEQKEGSLLDIKSIHFHQVHTFLNHKYRLTHDIRLRLIHGLFNYVFNLSFYFPIRLESKALRLLSRLLKKAWKTPYFQTQVVLDWRIVYDALNDQYLVQENEEEANVNQYGKSLTSQHRKDLIGFVTTARRYFKKKSNLELWNKISHFLSNPQNITFYKGIGLFMLFFNPQDIEGMISKEENYWISKWISLWSQIDNCNEWDIQWFQFFSRIIKYNSSSIEFFQPYLSFIYSRLLNAFNLPAGEGKRPENKKWPLPYQCLTIKLNDGGIQLLIKYMCKLCIYLCHSSSTNNDSISYLLEFLSLCKTFYHPSNSIRFVNKLSSLLQYLSFYLSQRIGYEKALNQSSFLKENHILLLIDVLIDYGIHGMYSKSSTLVFASSYALGQLAFLYPLYVSKKVMIHIAQAFQEDSSINHSHQAPSATGVLIYFIHPCLIPIPSLTKYFTIVLQDTLNGLNSNDSLRILATLLLYNNILQLIPIKDNISCLSLKDKDMNYSLNHNFFLAYEEINLEERKEFIQLAYESNSFIMNWSLNLLDTLFQMILKQSEMNSSLDGKKNRSSQLTMDGMISKSFVELLHQLYMQMSCSIYSIALLKTSSFISSCFLPHDGKRISELIHACVFPFPQKGLHEFLTLVQDHVFIIKISSSSSSSSSISSYKDGIKYELKSLSDSEYLWYLRIIDGAIRDTGIEILKYQRFLMEIMLHFQYHKNKKLRKLCCKILRHLLRSLTHIYPLSFSSISSLSSSYKDHHFINWENPIDSLDDDNSWNQLNIQWHESNEKELLFTKEIVQEFIMKPMNEIRGLINQHNENLKNKDLWKIYLNQLFHGVRGSLFLFIQDESTFYIPLKINSLLIDYLNYFHACYHELFKLCHEIFQYFSSSFSLLSSSSSSYDTKPFTLLISIMNLLLINQGKRSSIFQSNLSKISMFKRGSRCVYMDTFMKTKHGLKEYYNEQEEDRAWKCLIRSGYNQKTKIHRIYLHLMERLEEKSFLIPQKLKDKHHPHPIELYETLIQDMIVLSQHLYLPIRSLATSSIENIFPRYPWMISSILQNLLNQLISSSSTSSLVLLLSYEQYLGIFTLLKLPKSIEIISSDQHLFFLLIQQLISATAFIQSIPQSDHQIQVENVLQDCFLVYSTMWYPCIHLQSSSSLSLSSSSTTSSSSSSSSSLSFLIRIKENYELQEMFFSEIFSKTLSMHWKYQFIFYSLLIPFTTTWKEIKIHSRIWQFILQAMHFENILPLRKLGIQLLYRCLLCIKKQKKYSSSYDSLENNDDENNIIPIEIYKEMMKKEWMEQLIQTIIQLHPVSTCSADGQNMDQSPLNWSRGINEILHLTNLVYDRYTLYETKSSIHFNEQYADFIKLYTNIIYQNDREMMIQTWMKIIIFLLNNKEQYEERHATLCTISEVLSGLLKSCCLSSSSYNPQHYDKNDDNHHNQKKKKDKENNQNGMEGIWKVMLELYDMALSNLNLEWTCDYIDGFRYLSLNLSPFLYEPLIDHYFHQLDNLIVNDHNNYISFVRYLKVVQGLFMEGSNELYFWEKKLQFLLIHILKPNLSHPYKICREEIGRTLFFIVNEYKIDLNDIFDELIIHSLHQLKMNTQEIEIHEMNQEEKEKKNEKGMIHLDEIKNGKESILYFLIYSIENGTNVCIKKQILSCLPIVFSLQNHSNVELNALAKYCLEKITQGNRLLYYSKDIYQDLRNYYYDLCLSIKQSNFWKIRNSLLIFLTPFLAHHHFILSTETRKIFHEIIIDLFNDPQREVQILALKTFCGVVAGEKDSIIETFANYFLDQASQYSNRKATTKRKKILKELHHHHHRNEHHHHHLHEHPKKKQYDEYLTQQKLLQQRGVLGLAAIVQAFPYSIPSYLPKLLQELISHLYGSSSFIQKIVQTCLTEFKRTHSDNWQDHKQHFTNEQLEAINDVLISPHYYA